jgi:hypothetical protein
MSKTDICPKCWHEGCKGNCETPAERKARELREQIAAITRRQRRDKKGGKR